MSKSRQRILGALAAVLIIGGAQAWADEVWVTNMKSANVTVFDAASHQVIATIPAGKGAHNVVISGDGKLALVANVGGNSVTVIDAAGKKVLGTVAAGVKTHHVSLSPDGKWAIACNVGDGTITLIDVAKRQAVHSMPMGAKTMMSVFAPDGRTAYVAIAGESKIEVLDLESRAGAGQRCGSRVWPSGSRIAGATAGKCSPPTAGSP